MYTVMRKTKFYPTIWQTVPFSLDMMKESKADGKLVKDLILKNNYASEKRISEMKLNVIKFSALDISGSEHLIKEFSESENLQIKGMHTGLFIKTKSILNLNPGAYKTFRLYISEKGNEFKYADRSKEQVYRFDYLDFEIENGLELTGNEAKQILLRFDLQRFTFSSYFKSITKLFHGTTLKRTKWANSFGN
jgi:hypothetical protein